jgi:hypothetical protein
MKARWQDRDYAAMERKALTFTDTDVLLTQRGLSARRTRLVASLASENSSD